MIDLRKGGLLAVLCNLPYRIVIPLPVRTSEVLDLSEHQWQALDGAGMITHDLTHEEVGQALLFKGHHPGLSANDCICLVTALAYPGILLTGDALLRRVGAQSGLLVHGVLWVVDQLDSARCCNRSLLIKALEVWQGDDTVFLPTHEISTRIRRLSESGS